MLKKSFYLVLKDIRNYVRQYIYTYNSHIIRRIDYLYRVKTEIDCYHSAVALKSLD